MDWLSKFKTCGLFLKKETSFIIVLAILSGVYLLLHSWKCRQSFLIEATGSSFAFPANIGMGIQINSDLNNTIRELECFDCRVHGSAFLPSSIVYRKVNVAIDSDEHTLWLKLGKGFSGISQRANLKVEAAKDKKSNTQLICFKADPFIPLSLVMEPPYSAFIEAENNDSSKNTGSASAASSEKPIVVATAIAASRICIKIPYGTVVSSFLDSPIKLATGQITVNDALVKDWSLRGNSLLKPGEEVKSQVLTADVIASNNSEIKKIGINGKTEENLTLTAAGDGRMLKYGGYVHSTLLLDQLYPMFSFLSLALSIFSMIFSLKAIKSKSVDKESDNKNQSQ